MQTITKYKANDGKEFNSERDAISHESLLSRIDVAMVPLGKTPKDDGCDFANGGGFIQHSRLAVDLAKLALIELWDGDQKTKDAAKISPPSHSIIGRYLSDSNSPIYPAWCRLLCIDSEFREWGQPYFAQNPSQGKQFQIR